MSKYIPGNHKHLTAADRLYIEHQLNAGSSFKDIARYPCKDPSTISKEIRSHRLSDFYPGRGLFLNAKNFRIHHSRCRKKNVCGKIIPCDIKCASCPSCNQHCKDFVKERCKRLDRAPYVCSGCGKGHARCTIPHKYHYDALFADRRYRETLRDSRPGISLPRENPHRIDTVITPLIRQGHSPIRPLLNIPSPVFLSVPSTST